MDTKVLKVDNRVDNLINYPQIVEGANYLAQNDIVAFPTETVYGLGGNAYSEVAIAKIFAAKGRPSDNPLIIHIGSTKQLEGIVADVSPEAKRLMDAFWPGPLTIVFNKKDDQLSELATTGLSTVAVRMPDHPIALALINRTNLPIAAPSANTSGKPSPTKAAHVLADLNGKIRAIIDGGQTGVGVESTVIDCTVTPPMILRPGGISREAIEAVVGEVTVDLALLNSKEAPRSPGMKYRHYAPTVPLYVVKGSTSFFKKIIEEKRFKEGLRVGVLTTEENQSIYEADVVLACGKRQQLETVATELFDTLRAFDETDVEVILTESFPETGIGSAIMNRLLKAAGNHVLEEG